MPNPKEMSGQDVRNHDPHSWEGHPFWADEKADRLMRQLEKAREGKILPWDKAADTAVVGFDIPAPRGAKALVTQIEQALERAAEENRKNFPPLTGEDLANIIDV